MATKALRTCDHCGNPIEDVIIKLYMAPVVRGQTRITSTNYTASMDIGECCIEWAVKEMGNWQKRGKRRASPPGRLRQAS